jgi:hypothetical protein
LLTIKEIALPAVVSRVPRGAAWISLSGAVEVHATGVVHRPSTTRMGACAARRLRQCIAEHGLCCACQMRLALRDARRQLMVGFE